MPFYNNIDEILDTRGIVKLPEVRDTHDEEKDTISFNERETDEIVVDNKKNQLNS